MINKEDLMQKQGIMLMLISKDFLEKDVGDRIETVKNMSEKYNMARGTVQTALKTLQENGAITLEPRGHLGTFIRFIDHKKLLKISGIENIVCVMPLPYTKKYEGMATGLYNVINKHVSFSLAFMRGSDNRLKFLKEGRYDLSITSKLTANHYINQGEEIEIVACLGKESYVDSHALIVKNDFQGFTRGMRVGLDSTSYDQKYLTKEFFKDKDVEFVEVKYSHIVEHIKNNYIDAAIWSVDEVINKEDDLKTVELDLHERNLLDREAVIISRKENKAMIKFISKFLDVEEVLSIQSKVINKKIVPSY